MKQIKNIISISLYLIIIVSSCSSEQDDTAMTSEPAQQQQHSYFLKTTQNVMKVPLLMRLKQMYSFSGKKLQMQVLIYYKLQI